MEQIETQASDLRFLAQAQVPLSNSPSVTYETPRLGPQQGSPGSASFGGNSAAPGDSMGASANKRKSSDDGLASAKQTRSKRNRVSFFGPCFGPPPPRALLLPSAAPPSRSTITDFVCVPSRAPVTLSRYGTDTALCTPGRTKGADGTSTYLLVLGGWVSEASQAGVCLSLPCMAVCLPAVHVCSSGLSFYDSVSLFSPVVFSANRCAFSFFSFLLK